MIYLNKKQRNPWLDYLKSFAIYLVIVGHVLSNCMQNGGANRVYGVIYFIHIPLFLVISGLLVKDKPIDKDFWLGLLKRFVIPYTVWTVILTTFYQGFGHLLHDGFWVNLEVYFCNWCHSFLWFIKAYLVTYILWQILQKLTPLYRLMAGTVLLAVINLCVQSSSPLAEIASLSLYSYTLFGAGACIKKYIGKIDTYGVILFGLCFLLCLPFATPQNNYFECSFTHMLETGDWYIFIIRFVAGTSISVALVCIGKLIRARISFINNGIIQSVGQRTLQIYMLQSLLVEAALNRVVHLNNDFVGNIEAFAVACLMTILCNVIIQKTMKFNLCKFLLWGTK